MGPADLRAGVRAGSGGCRVGSRAGFDDRVSERPAVEPIEPFAFPVGADGVLRPAPRPKGCPGASTFLLGEEAASPDGKSGDPRGLLDYGRWGR